MNEFRWNVDNITDFTWKMCCVFFSITGDYVKLEFASRWIPWKYLMFSVWSQCRMYIITNLNCVCIWIKWNSKNMMLVYKTVLFLHWKFYNFSCKVSCSFFMFHSVKWFQNNILQVQYNEQRSWQRSIWNLYATHLLAIEVNWHLIRAKQNIQINKVLHNCHFIEF